MLWRPRKAPRRITGDYGKLASARISASPLPDAARPRAEGRTALAVGDEVVAPPGVDAGGEVIIFQVKDAVAGPLVALGLVGGRAWVHFNPEDAVAGPRFAPGGVSVPVGEKPFPDPPFFWGRFPGGPGAGGRAEGNPANA